MIRGFPVDSAIGGIANRIPVGCVLRRSDGTFVMCAHITHGGDSRSPSCPQCDRRVDASGSYTCDQDSGAIEPTRLLDASKLPIDSDTYFERAMCLYKYQWGAIGKYEWLKWKVTMDRLRSSRRTSSFKETRLIGDVIRVTHHSESAPSQSILDING